MIDRRQLLASTLGVAAAAPAGMARAAETESAKLSTLFDTFFQEMLRRNPETATNLGLDTGPNADLRGQLHDESAAGIEAGKALNAEQLRRLAGVDRAQLSLTEQLNFDVVRYTREASARMSAFPFGTGGTSPYAISQQNGAYQAVPDFLDTKHPLATEADAEAYLKRLEGFAVLMDQNTERQKHDAALGVIPPDFILDRALSQMAALNKPAGESALVQALPRRLSAAGLALRTVGQASELYERFVRPALARQIASTQALRARAKPDAGMRGRPGGEAFYAAALRSHTTTTMTPDEVHKLGRDQSAEIAAKLDALLRARGLTQGTVGARIRGLYSDPTSFFPNTDAGKVDLIAYCNERQAAIQPRLPRFFKRQPPYRFEVRRVPPAIEAGASSAYAQGPSLDGSRPGIVYFNLADSAEWPRWSLPTTIFHEGLPGHQLESGLALSNAALPMIRKVSGFAAYSEGWGLYAEQLGDELGMYDDDPLGRIGYLRFQLFRAARCVVDTGIHHLGWSREQAIAHFVETDGDAPGFAAREVERYCVGPGQACSYKIGHTVWNKVRQRAATALGDRYDIKDFHEAGLGCGRVPLDVLEGVIDRYIAGQRSV